MVYGPWSFIISYLYIVKLNNMKFLLPYLLFTLSFSFFTLTSSLYSQKEIYIPQDWQQGNLDYSFDRSAESENFIVFWGPLAGLDPTQAPADIAFDPQTILNTAED